jgi:hypothetical protein
MKVGVAGEELVARDHAVAAAIIGDEAARLADQDDSDAPGTAGQLAAAASVIGGKNRPALVS